MTKYDKSKRSNKSKKSKGSKKSKKSNKSTPFKFNKIVLLDLTHVQRQQINDPCAFCQ